jgi:hypothetical protein
MLAYDDVRSGSRDGAGCGKMVVVGITLDPQT